MAEQQRNQRAPENKNRISKQIHDIKLAESLSPITKKLDTINERTKNLGEVLEKSIPQPAFENAPFNQLIENNEGVIYAVEIENTL